MPTNISIELVEFLDLFLGHDAYRGISEKLADTLDKADSNHVFIYVEYPSEVNGYDNPVVWRIKDWNTNYETYKQKKELADLQRQVYREVSDVIDRVAKSLASKTGTEVALMKRVADAIVINRQWDKIEMFGGGKAADLREADTQLSIFMSKHGKIKKV